MAHFQLQHLQHAQQQIFARNQYNAWQIEKIRQLILPLLSPVQHLLNYQHKRLIKDQLKCLDQNIARADLPYAFACAVYVHAQYQELKSYYQCQDYNDLILSTIIQQAQHGSARYRWLQIDEVQDLSPLHWLCIDYLKTDDAHILVFGDLHQSIYRFLGASIALTQQRLGQHVHYLVDNFRNPENLVDLTNQYRQAHFDSSLLINAVATQTAHADALLHLQRDYDDQQQMALLELIHQSAKNQQSTAVLCSTNQQVEDFSQQLQRQGIAHFCVTQQDVMNSPLALDFLAFLNCLITDEEPAAWARILWRFADIKTHPPRHLAHLDAELAAIKLQHDLQHYGFKVADFVQIPTGFRSQQDYFLYLYQQQQLLFIDTETTGLNPAQDDIIQIAAFNQQQEINLYCHSTQDLSTSHKIHHIDQDILRQQGQDFAQQCQHLLNRSEPYAFIAHNLKFDDQMLAANIQRNAPTLYNSYRQRIKFCSLKLMRQLYPHLSSYKLADLLIHFNLEGVNSHNALDDVKAGYNLLPIIAAKIQDNQLQFSTLYTRSQNCLQHLHAKLSPLYTHSREQIEKNSSFRLQDLLQLYCDYVAQHLPMLYAEYEPQHTKQLTSKLAQHSQLHFDADTSLHYWQKVLEFYQTAKESDLITPADYVIVSTMHRAKGLEFEQVILPNLVDRYFPSYPVIKKLQSPDPLHQQEAQQLLLEQQRLLYVALTRAKSKLIVGTFRKKRSEQRHVKPHLYAITPFLDEFQHLFKNI